MEDKGCQVYDSLCNCERCERYRSAKSEQETESWRCVVCKQIKAWPKGHIWNCECGALNWVRVDSEHLLESKLFYIQDTRAYCGNSVEWWRKDGFGYTANLDEAWRVDLDKAKSICASRSTDKMWPCDEIDAHSQRHLDMQYLPKTNSEALPANMKIFHYCNRHADCEAAEAELLTKNPGRSISLSFHCHDDCCEDCFGC